MASPSFLSVFLLSLLSLFSFSSSSPHTITIPLSPSTKTPSHANNPWERLNHLASASLARAHHLKHLQNSSLAKTPLYARSYGGYSVSLSFGTPPQTLPFVMDTGSSLTWFPCTRRYACSMCNFPNVDPKNVSIFVPRLSSSSRILGCKNPKCGWIYGSDVGSRCCDPTSGNCTQICPPYFILYGTGSTSGLLLSETLSFPDRSVDDFVVGCSIESTRQPSGIAGFGRGPESLPVQMGLKKFSYCMVSHRFDDTPESSDLVLESGSGPDDGKTGGVTYTPFRKNPVTNSSVFQDYYYVTLRRIMVGGKNVRIPYKFLEPGPDGSAGTIIDSGTTFTFMDREVFEPVAREFQKQMANFSRSVEVENRTGLQPCFNVSGDKPVFFPELTFQFKGGAKISLPLADYFSLVDLGVVCMTIVANNAAAAGPPGGPSIILGNYQQQNFYVEYDLQNNRLGFRKQVCK